VYLLQLVEASPPGKILIEAPGTNPIVARALLHEEAAAPGWMTTWASALELGTNRTRAPLRFHAATACASAHAWLGTVL